MSVGAATDIVRGAASPVPLISLLPAAYQEDDFTQRFVAGFDAVLLPVITALDCLDAYLDAQLAPLDFLDWLAGWAGVVVSPALSEQDRRELVARIVELYGRRGTSDALRDEVRLRTGLHVEVRESGGVECSPSMPAAASAHRCEVTIVVPAGIDEQRVAEVDAIVALAKPAHVTHRTRAQGSGT